MFFSDPAKVRLFSVGFSTIFIFFISLSFLISSVYSQEFDEEVPDEIPDYIEIVEDAEFGMMYIPSGKTVVEKQNPQKDCPRRNQEEFD